MTSKFDYLTLSVKTKNSVDSAKDMYKALEMLRKAMLLDDLFKRLQPQGHCKFYDKRYSYENVSLKLPKPQDYSRQGIALEFTSKGLDYFADYLKAYNLTLKSWLGMWRGLCFGCYETKITRVDYAMDDICYDNAPTTISIRRVLSGIMDGELCCKSRIWSDEGSDFSRFAHYKSCRKRVNGEQLEGTTVQLGRRNGETTICRFYDKLTEQKQKGVVLPENMTAWTRSEFEFHGKYAMAVVNNFLDRDDKGFSEYMCGVALNYVRFVDRTSDNVSRCAVKRWWKAFLNGATKAFSLPHVSPARSALGRSLRGLKQYSSTCYTFIEKLGPDGFLQLINDLVVEQFEKNKDPFRKELADNIDENNAAYEEWTAYKRYDYNSDLPSETLHDNMSRDIRDFCQVFYDLERGNVDGSQYTLGGVREGKYKRVLGAWAI